MKLTTLASALMLTCLPNVSVFAAALDRSGQSMQGFLQPGNYFEAGINILDPKVSGVDLEGNKTGDMGEDYYFPSAVLKVQATEHISFGLMYDQPFGAAAAYSGDNAFVARPNDTLLPTATTDAIIERRMPGLLDQGAQQILGEGATFDQLAAPIQRIVRRQVEAKIQEGLNNVNGYLNNNVTGGTTVDVDTQNLAFVMGVQPTENWNIYGGGVYQTVKGKVALRGTTYSLYNGYDADIGENHAFGWLAGVAYEIPEIALKASLTYRSEIEHEVNVRENIGMLLPASALLGLEAQAAAINASQADTKITTPQSVNLDFQTGVMTDTVLFGNVRWVEWSKFAIQPHKFGLLSQVVGGLGLVNQANGFNLVDYSKDQWSANLGVGRKLNPKWGGTLSVGWDSGAGNPVSTLGPTEGYWNVGLGARYTPQPGSEISFGAKYLWLGDADAQTGAHTPAGRFSNNDAMAYGLKIAQRF